MKRVLLGALLVGGVALGCEGPFAHSNPFDSYADYSHQIQGARTTSDWAQDTLDFELISTPSVGDYNVDWSANPPFISHIGNGRFVTVSTGLVTRNIWIRGKFGIHGDSMLIQVRQVADSIALRCQGESQCPVMTVVGQNIYITSTVLDVRRQTIPVFAATDPSVIVSRDPSIVSIIGTGALLPLANLRAAGEGSTWVVATIGGTSDSLLVTVDLP